MNPRISIVTTFRNEEQVLAELLTRIKNCLEPLEKNYEVILVNDASNDGSLVILKKAALEDSRIRLLNMSSRFGVPACLMAGLAHATGEAIITMDADLQDPPEVIPQLIAKWQAGAEIVYTIRSSRAGEPQYKKWMTQAAYRILNLFSSDVDLPIEAGDFRLISKRALKELLKYPEKEPYLRGLIRLIGFKQDSVTYNRAARFKGESHFPVLTAGPINTFLSGIFTFTNAPVIAIGCFSLFFLFLLLLNIVFQFHFSWSTITLFFLVCLFFSLTLIAYYLHRIHLQSLNRPSYIIESKLNFPE